MVARCGSNTGGFYTTGRPVTLAKRCYSVAVTTRVQLSVWVAKRFASVPVVIRLLRTYQKIRCVALYVRPVRATGVAKKLSAMLRVRNEERFLRQAVLSIVDAVDEIVLIDNRSTDGTPAIIADLAKLYPGKIRALSYDHDVLPVGGKAYREEMANDPASPRLTANFYNWCTQQCFYPYVIKWDGDMIALPSFAASLAAFRASGAASLYFEGITVHPDGEHEIPNSSNIEARVMPKDSVRYVNTPSYEQAAGPGLRPGMCAWRPLYLHMKYVKAKADTPAPADRLSALARGIALEALMSVAADVSVVIPAYNEERSIEACVRGAFSCGARLCEVVVVDNDSTDRTAAILRSLANEFAPRFAVVGLKQHGLSLARQAGFAVAKGEYVASVDADCLPDRVWFERMLAEFREHPRTVCVSGPYWFHDLPPAYRPLFLVKEALLRVLPFGRSQLCGGNNIIRRDALLRVGGFDTSVRFTGEDVAMERRLRSLGPVVFRRSYAIRSSSRRVVAEGLVKSFLKPRVNRLYQLLTGRPLFGDGVRNWR